MAQMFRGRTMMTVFNLRFYVIRSFVIEETRSQLPPHIRGYLSTKVSAA